MSEYDWHPVVLLRWSAEGKLQQHWKRRVSSSRGIWYDEFEWRDVPTQETAVAVETSTSHHKHEFIVEAIGCPAKCWCGVYARDVQSENDG